MYFPEIHIYADLGDFLINHPHCVISPKGRFGGDVLKLHLVCYTTPIVKTVVLNHPQIGGGLFPYFSVVEILLIGWHPHHFYYKEPEVPYSKNGDE